MEESEEYILKRDNNIFKYHKNIENMDISNSDPIPSLLLPIKKTKKPKSLISQLISHMKNKINNLNQIQIKINNFLINKNLQNHNSTPEQKNVMLVNDLIESKETHFIAIFKDYLISDYQEEFLRRYFNINEINEVIPKFYQYYKNYLIFFCKGTFCDFDLNEIMQEYGECQAEFYYNKNYGHKERKNKKEKKNKLDDNNNHEINNNLENVSDIKLLKLIFTKSIEYSIEKVQNSNGNILNKHEELSNIKPYNNNSKENTLILPDNSTVSTKDILTKENSIRNIINLMYKKENRILLNKRLTNKKRDIIVKNNNNNNNNESNKKLNNNINNLSNSRSTNKLKKEINSLSKTTSNLNIKTQKNKKI